MIAAQLRRVASREERRADAELSLREYVDYLFGQPPLEPLELPRGLLNIVGEAHRRGAVLG